MQSSRWCKRLKFEQLDRNQKETFISKVVGNEIRDYDSIEYVPKSNNEICTDAFTDYNYNFKL